MRALNIPFKTVVGIGEETRSVTRVLGSRFDLLDALTNAMVWHDSSVADPREIIVAPNGYVVDYEPTDWTDADGVPVPLVDLVASGFTMVYVHGHVQVAVMLDNDLLSGPFGLIGHN